ncbi:GIY-YIG nuclease family protein [Alphaproteobacteria bacterium]|nr:GIY-YIG nuclease family protein [Alphaproteobacteria bacterium]
MKWFVYMLRCRDDSIYTGITNNLNKRIESHMSGNGSKYLRGRLPVKLIYKEIFLNRSDASKREIEIKKLLKKEKEVLIKSTK